MRIGEVAKAVGISALPSAQARRAGRREMGQAAILRLRFVRLAQHAGFTVEEIKALLAAFEAEATPGPTWAAAAAGST